LDRDFLQKEGTFILFLFSIEFVQAKFVCILPHWVAIALAITAVSAKYFFTTKVDCGEVLIFCGQTLGTDDLDCKHGVK
jgi:hypothetical protein